MEICKYFLPFCRCFFTLLIVSFAQKIFYVWCSPIYLFLLLFLVFLVQEIAHSSVMKLFSLFFSKSFIISHLTFRLLIFFLVNFSMWCKISAQLNFFSNFIHLHVDTQFSWHHLLKRLFFSPFSGPDVLSPKLVFNPILFMWSFD